jgi:hypothetical protein
MVFPSVDADGLWFMSIFGLVIIHSGWPRRGSGRGTGVPVGELGMQESGDFIDDPADRAVIA